MALSLLANDPGWDQPFFKILSPTDTGADTGHGSAILIPKVLTKYFPTLGVSGTRSEPTSDHPLVADLIIDGRLIERVGVRYQFQTRGGTRSPEFRITEKLTPLRKAASKGDCLVIYRNLSDPDHYSLILVKVGSPDFSAIARNIEHRSAGPLYEDGERLPLTDADHDEARKEQDNRELEDFSMFDEGAAASETTIRRIARSVVFRKKIKALYGDKCCICHISLRTPSGLSELEAAHIVPRRLGGADDARNGLGLCRSHHWAFDKGLFGVGIDRRVVVPEQVSALPENESLTAHRSSRILEASNARLQAAEMALQWHRATVLVR